MKKIILFAAILFAGVSVVKAEGPKSEGQTKLTVTLKTIQSISVNEADVSIVYSTTDHYLNGNNSGVFTKHLSVYSTGGFDVKVNYDLKNATDSYSEKGSDYAAGTAQALFESIQAVVVDGEKDQASVTLTTTGQSLITSTTGGTNLNYGVRYDGAGTSKYMDYTRAQDRVFTANVIYTITPN